MPKGIFGDIKKDISVIKRALGIRDYGFTQKEEIPDRVAADLDVRAFLQYFFLDPELASDEKKTNALLQYMTKELVSLKQNRELSDSRKVVQELMKAPALKEKLEEFVEENYELISHLESRDEMAGPDDWRRKLIYWSKVETKKFIGIEYKILKSYVSLVEIARAIESKTEFLGAFQRLGKHIADSEYCKYAAEMVDSLERFGEARLYVRYDYFNEVKDTASIRFKKKEKSIRETLSWFWSKVNKRKPFLGHASKEEVLYAEALDMLIKKNLQHLVEIVRHVSKIGFFLGGLRYIKEIENAGLPLVFPSFNRKNELSIQELYNPCLLAGKLTEIVPNDVQSESLKNVAIITGPNNSGKSVYVKSIGLAYCLAQNGFPIPAKTADLVELDNVITLFVSPGNIFLGEGMFLDELRRVKELFLAAKEKSLLIIDEPIRGSAFEDAEEITLRIIKGVKFLKAPTFLTTHLHSVAKKASSWQGVRNLRTETKNGFNPTYKIVPGRDRSYGVEIADGFGLKMKDILRIVKKKK